MDCIVGLLDCFICFLRSVYWESNSHKHTLVLYHPYLTYLQGEKQDELYLNLVLEYVPETVYSISRQHQKSKMALPLLYVKLYLYQLSRALSHIHALGICHRDIKPQNLLVNPTNQQLKLCDFGSAKALVKGEPNVSYICSRYYRAPELIFGSTDYSTAIDIWSQGKLGIFCVYFVGWWWCPYLVYFVSDIITFPTPSHFNTQAVWVPNYYSANHYSPVIQVLTN